MGTVGSDRRSVDRVKKFPWNADMRIPEIPENQCRPSRPITLVQEHAIPLDPRTRMTASKHMGLAKTVPNSVANLMASSDRVALNPG